MPVQITDQAITLLAPSARSSYREAFANAQPVLDQFGISDSPLRMAHFMAQVLHESGGLMVQFENLNYSADRLPKVWPSRFQPTGPLNPGDYAHNPQKLANEVYGRRMGNSAPNDGFTYRGRGLLQLTGRDSYQEATQILRGSIPDAPDFVQAPDEVISADWCVKVAAAEWQQKGCNEKADADSITQVTKAINGGLIGLAERKEWLKRTKAVWS
ncbi:MAG: glycoside hydrolase family 19 protein [Proteobacteria bacterium]|nr:glycoside hydrolase family 19 protein [Pseudomonadota bacterium]